MIQHRPPRGAWRGRLTPLSPFFSLSSMKSERYSGDRELRLRKYSKSPAIVCLKSRSLLKDSRRKRSKRDFRSSKPCGGGGGGLRITEWVQMLGPKPLPGAGRRPHLDVVDGVLSLALLRHQGLALLPEVQTHTLTHGLQPVGNPAEQLVHARQICDARQQRDK